MGKHGCVIAGHHLAAQIALDLLRSGANAMDAAIAAAIGLSILKPDACGLGSDMFALYADASSGRISALNASGVAPALATPGAFSRGIEPTGLRAACVPGAVYGWEAARRRFGTLPLDALIEPTIAYARDGMPVSSAFAQTLTAYASLVNQNPATAAVFCPSGMPFAAGAMLAQPDAAAILESIARGGPADFYRGAFAAELDTYSRETDGLLRAQDLVADQSSWHEPLRVQFGDYEVVGQPPVSVGIIVLQGIKILGATEIGAFEDCSADFIHCHVEALKLATADLHAHIGDPAVEAAQPIDALLDGMYARKRAGEISLARAQRFTAGVLNANLGSDTSYVAIMDSAGNTASLLQSVFHVFGCGVVIPNTGVVMNNRMMSFSLHPDSPNRLQGGKRPLNTLNPLLVLHGGKVILSLGTPGGPSQTYTNSLLLLRLLQMGYDVQRAVEAPRWFVAPDGKLHIETSVGNAVLAELERRGHELVPVPNWHASMGGAGVLRLNDSGVREAGADPRRESYAVAY